MANSRRSRAVFIVSSPYVRSIRPNGALMRSTSRLYQTVTQEIRYYNKSLDGSRYASLGWAMSNKRRLTQRPMVFAAIRMPSADRERWYEASRLLGISQSAFLRDALRERADRVLEAAQHPR